MNDRVAYILKFFVFFMIPSVIALGDKGTLQEKELNPNPIFLETVPRFRSRDVDDPFAGQDLSPENILKNEMKSAGGENCPSVCIVFARGTGEPGNVGVLAGPPFFKAMRDALGPGGGKMAVQGVEYDASVPGFLAGGSPIGATNMAKIIKDTAKNCPDTKIIPSGYSQGAQVVHIAVDSLPSDVSGKIDSIVMFGDPRKGAPFKDVDASKVMTICHPTDLICAGQSVILASHLTYSVDAKSAAQFAASKL